MSLYFRPEKAVLGDVIPYYDNGVFKPFYLRNYRANRDEQHQDSWVMLSTTDHIHYTEHDTKIVGGTGSVIKVDGLYHMFYCTFQKLPEKNYMNHAVSTDLDVWTEIPEDRFASDDVIYEPIHWRDPFVFWSEEENCWWMIFAAQKKGKTTRRSCVGLCKSKDLHHWDYCEPFYAPMNAQCAFECPDFFRMGDWYYLVFSSYADRYQTMYRKSRSPYGPWQTPEVDTFDTRAFYAAKTGSTFMTQTLEIVLNAIVDMMYGKFTDVLDATSAEAELESHGMIIQAIRERDVEKARKLMDEHLITSMNMFQ